MAHQVLLLRVNTRQRFLLAIGLVALSALVSVLAAPALPERMISHWNIAGQPDATMATPVALVLFPALSAALVGLFWLLPRIDPLGENVVAFRPAYDWFLVVLTAYLLALHVGVIAFNLGFRFDFTAFVLAGVAVLFYAVGELLSHARRNWFVGIRTPWTLSSEAVWDRTHALGGRLFKVTALLTLVGLIFGEYAVYFLLVPALLTAAATVIYSFVLYRRLDGDPGTELTDCPRH